MFGWAAAIVLVVSFVALATLWPKPKFAVERWRPLPGGLGRLLASRPIQAACGLIGVSSLALLVWAGLAGTQDVTENITPTFVFVIFWVGLVPLSVLFGDVFRAFNPWRAIGYAFAKLLSTVAGSPIEAPFRYPARFGRWPAAAGILLFATMELVVASGNLPRNLAIATLIYSALTLVGMVLFGVKAWIEQGEAFSVYFNLFSRISVFGFRDGQIGLRPLLSGLAALPKAPGTVPLLAIMIGTITFDGAGEGPLIAPVVQHLQKIFGSVGLASTPALEASLAFSMVACILIIFGFYRLGIAGAHTVDREYSSKRLADEFVHTLVPIAFVYVGAHYLTYLLFQGQALSYLISDPLGNGHNYFGTAHGAVDYTVIGSSTAWYLQVALVIVGHVAALTLAHDRALVLYKRAADAVHSQYWMLGVMVGFTSLALWLLSEANA